MTISKKIFFAANIFFVLFFFGSEVQALTCISCRDLDQSSWSPTTQAECDSLLRLAEGTDYRGIKQFGSATYDCAPPLEEPETTVLCPFTPTVTFGGTGEVSVVGETEGAYNVVAKVRVGSENSSLCPLGTEGEFYLTMQDSSGTERGISSGTFEVGNDLFTTTGVSLDEVMSKLGKNIGDTTNATINVRFPGSSAYPLYRTIFTISAAAAGGPGSPAYQYVSTPPVLEIPIPTLPNFGDFAPVNPEGEAGNRYLSIPWIGQYIGAIYQYIIGVVGILAGIMIMVAGLIWLTAGGSAERIGAAKKYLEGALVGLVISLTSFLVLYAINPALVSFENLKVKYIERVTWDEVDTTAASLAAAAESGGRGPIATSEQCDTTLANCYVTFSAEAQADTGTGPGNIRALEFMRTETGVGHIDPRTTRDKVMAIANQAANCCVILGSCGESNLRINFAAGVPQAIAGQRGIGRGEELKNGLGLSYRGISRHELPAPQKEYLDTMNCDGSIPDCKSSAQIRAVYERLRSEVGGGYPDTWADELVPGDSITIFNANSSVRGGHAAIFMGWSSRAGVANVIQGSPGKVVKRGTLCLKSTCGTPFPFIATFKAQP